MSGPPDDGAGLGEMEDAGGDETFMTGEIVLDTLNDSYMEDDDYYERTRATSLPRYSPPTSPAHSPTRSQSLSPTHHCHKPYHYERSSISYEPIRDAAGRSLVEGMGEPGLSLPSLPRGILVPPLGYATVCPGRIYRSGYPIACNLPFLEKLRLRSMLCLCPRSQQVELLQWTNRQGIEVFEGDVGDNKEPFQSMRDQPTAQALRWLADERNHPILVYCTTGKNRTGCVVARLRRLQGWCLGAIFDEYTRYSGRMANLLDFQFIELQSEGDKSMVDKRSPQHRWML
ncbi:unnamed protein product [Chrysoparadoxa australica]